MSPSSSPPSTTPFLLVAVLLATATLTTAQVAPTSDVTSSGRICRAYSVTTSATTDVNAVADAIDVVMQRFLKSFTNSSSYSLELVQGSNPLSGTVKVKFAYRFRSRGIVFLRNNLKPGTLNLQFKLLTSCASAPMFKACKAYDVAVTAARKDQGETQVKNVLNAFKKKYPSSSYTLTRKAESKGVSVADVQVNVAAAERLDATKALDSSLVPTYLIKSYSEKPCKGAKLCKAFQIQFRPGQWIPLRKTIANMFQRRFKPTFPGTSYQLLRYRNRAQLRIFLNRDFTAPRAFLQPTLSNMKMIISYTVEDCYDFRRVCRAWSIRSLNADTFPLVQQDLQDVMGLLKTTYPQTTYEIKTVASNTSTTANVKVQLTTGEQTGAYNWLLENLSFGNIQYAGAITLRPCRSI